MKQLLQNLRDGKTTLADVPVPVPRPGMALIRTSVSLVSPGTERMVVEFAEKNLLGKARSRPDLVRQVINKAHKEGLFTTVQAAINRLDQPLALGYSASGIITDLGEGMEGFHPGERVACGGGGFANHAEYILVPKNLIVKLPSDVSFEEGAFTTLGAVAMQGFRLGTPQVGENVLVIGLGLLGQLSASIARAAGCQVLGTDTDPARVHLAEKTGINAADRANIEKIAPGVTGGMGFDVVLICADTPSNDPVELAGYLARDRATIVALGAVGFSIPRKTYYEKELKFIVSRSYGPGRYDPSYELNGVDYPPGYVRWTENRNMESFLELVASKRIDLQPLISHRFPIENAEKAYELITGGKNEPFLGVLLTYPEDVEVRSTVSYSLTPNSFQESCDKPVLGVLGAGNYASSVFLPVVRKVGGVKLKMIASANGMNASHLARKFRFHSATSDENQIYNDPGISIVAILTRHQHHSRQILASLEAGKHVFCEKPLAISHQELIDLVKTTSRDGRPILMAGFNRRFSPMGMNLKSFFQDRTEPLIVHYRVNAGYLPDNHWLHDPLQGGGRIIGEGCHFIDFMTFLTGSIPVAVRGNLLPDFKRYHGDNATLTFTFSDDSIGILDYLANGSELIPKEKVEVYGGGKTAILDDFRILTLATGRNIKVIRSRFRLDKGHKKAWEFFLRAVQGGGPPPIPYTDLWAVANASIVGAKSLQTGGYESIIPVG